MADLGGAAAGAVAGIRDVDAYEARQFELQRARQQEARQKEAAQAQMEGVAAARKRLMELYGAPTGPQPPLPGQASVPMMQRPAPQMSPTPPGGPGTAPAPTLPPYRAFQRGMQMTPTPVSSQFELAPKPQRLDLQSIVQGAPEKPEAYRAYMEAMMPYLSAQAKGEADQLKMDLQRERLQNQWMAANLASEDRRLSIQQRADAAKEAARLRELMLGIQKEKADTQKAAKGEKVTRASEKRAEAEDSRKLALKLVQELRITAMQHPEVVGLRGSVQRPLEAVSGAFGGGTSVAHDFQQKVRALQDIIKKVEPYGPEGRVLKGEIADRDQLVQGLGAWTSAANAVSGFNNLESWLNRNATTGGAAVPSQAGGRAEAPAAALAYLKEHPDAETKRHFKEKYGYLP